MDSRSCLPSGWTGLGCIAAPETVESLRTAFEVLLDEDVARARYPSRAACLAVCQRWPNAWRRHPAFRLWLDDVVRDGVPAMLLGSLSPRLLYLDVIVKQPGSTLHVPWHQDLPHWAISPDPTRVSPAGVLIWLALDDVDPASGGLRYLRGGLSDASPTAEHIDVVPAMRAGEALAHDPRAWHASGPNRTDRWRRACLAAFADASLPRKDGLPWDEAANPAYPASESRSGAASPSPTTVTASMLGR